MIINASNSVVRILLADDNADCREAMAALIRHFHYECDEAADGHEACDLLCQREYHLAIVDINMPGNCSLELLDAADEVAPGMPFILVTGAATIETALSAIGTQAQAYLEKPVPCERLLKAIEDALRSRHNRELMTEVVHVLNETRQNFKSRRLGEIRAKVECALSGSRAMRPIEYPATL